MAINGISVPRRYVPKNLTRKDKTKQARELRKSRKAYKQGKYYTRKKIKSFKSKESPHITKAKKMYNLNKIQLNFSEGYQMQTCWIKKNLSKRTRCLFFKW